MKYLDKEEKALIKEAKKHTQKAFKQMKKGTFNEGKTAKKMRADFGQAIEREKKSESISLRLEPSKLQSLKEIAQQEGLPYQTLINSVLHKFIIERKTQDQKAHSKYSQ